MLVLDIVLILAWPGPLSKLDWEAIRVDCFLEDEKPIPVIIIQVTQIEKIRWLFDLLSLLEESPIVDKARD